MRISRVMAAGLAALICLVAVACTPVQETDTTTPVELADSFGEPADPSAVGEGELLVMALSSEPDTLDPARSGSFYSRYVMNAMCQKLYDTDETSTVVPQLAAALPEISADGLTYTIALISGARFSDGTPLDASAVVTTIERNLAEGSNRRSELGPITSVTAVGDQQVRITLDEPFAPLTAALADRAGMIVSPTRLAETGEEGFGQQPSCVGPYTFTEWVPQTAIRLTKDPNFYDTDLVRYASLEYRIIIDSGIRAANLRSGDVQVADNLSTQELGTLLDNDALQILASTSLGNRAINFNIANVDGTGSAPGAVSYPTGGNDGTGRAIRTAFAHAIDREALVGTAFNGYYTASCSPITAPAYAEANQGCPAHDPELAQQLLADAGVQTPVVIEVLSSTNPDSLRLMQTLQAQVQPAGFDIRIDGVEEGTLNDAVAEGDYQAYLGEWSGRADPDANIRPFYVESGSSNAVIYNNPELSGLLSQASRQTDVAARIELYRQALSIVYTDNPRVYLFQPRNLTGVSSEVAGVQVFPDGIVRLAFAGPVA